jgi:hypothetical protein
MSEFEILRDLDGAPIGVFVPGPKPRRHFWAALLSLF